VIDNGRMILEIRTYRLKPGTREEFLRVMRTQAAPLMARFGITMVGTGGSLVDEHADSAILVRAYESLAVRDERENAFYGSDEWRSGPREAIVSRIEQYHTVVLETSEDAVRALRW